MQQLTDPMSIVIQAGDGHSLSEGVVSNVHDAAAHSKELGLIVLAHGEFNDKSDSALKATEILVDDMGFNFAPDKRPKALAEHREQVTVCLNESFENIHDYLVSTTQPQETAGSQGVSLAALQFSGQWLSVATIGEYNCLIFKSAEGDALNVSNPGFQLGSQHVNDAKIHHHKLSTGDIIVLMKSTDLLRLTEEFIRVTLSRFAESPEMAVKQINTRAKHKKMQSKPAIAICRVNMDVKGQNKGWFGK
jgi:hypothetical protein